MKKSAEKENIANDATCIKCGKTADRRFSFESDHGFIFLCSSQKCYDTLIKDLKEISSKNHPPAEKTKASRWRGLFNIDTW
jgi:hypothetical protein